MGRAPRSSGPLAIVVIGGLISATVLTLVLLPILYDRSANLGFFYARS